MSEKSLIIGVGVARSGTNFLSYLLDLQPDCFFTHEAYVFDWEKPVSHHEDFDRFEYLLSQDAPIVGDVSLGYVNHWNEILDQFPQCKMVFIVRNPEDNLRSLMNACAGGDFFISLPHGHPMYNDYWWRKFPTYGGSFESNAKRYIALHRTNAESAKFKYPDRVYVAQLEDLNTVEEKNRLFDFCGILVDGRVYTAKSTNKHKPNGQDKYINPMRKQVV